MPAPRPTRVATVGASSSANKGAASMLQAVIDELPGRIGPCHFAVLSTYPDDDRREPPHLPTGGPGADSAGISFVDSRGVATLGYNVLVTGIPLLLGRPVVKCAQALGPFDSPLNRVAARRVLGACAAVCPRGDRTEDHVAQLGLAARTRVVPAADAAFLMEVRPQ